MTEDDSGVLKKVNLLNFALTPLLNSQRLGKVEEFVGRSLLSTVKQRLKYRNNV